MAFLQTRCTGQFEVDEARYKIVPSVEGVNENLNPSNPTNSLKPIQIKKINLTFSSNQLELTEGSQAIVNLGIDKSYDRIIELQVTPMLPLGLTMGDLFEDFQTIVRVPKNSTSFPFSIKTKNDFIHRGTLNIPLQISCANPDIEVQNKEIAFNVMDNEPTPTVQFEFNDYLLSKASGENQIKVKLSGPSQWPISLRLTALDGTAVKNQDYLFADQMIQFNSGEVEKIVTLIIKDSTAQNTDKEFKLQIQPLSGADQLDSVPRVLLGSSNQTHVRILGGTSELPFLSLENNVIKEGTSQVLVNVSLSAPSTQEITLHWSTLEGTARPEEDYVPLTDQTLVFHKGEITKTLTIPLKDNDISEPVEYFNVNVTGLSGARMIKNSALVTVIDDEEWPTVQFKSPKQEVTEGIGVITLQLQLSHPSQLPIQVPLTFRNLTTIDGADYNPLTTSINFAPGQVTSSLSVKITDDELLENPETFEVTLGAPKNALVGPVPTAQITIQDNDRAVSVDYVKSETAGGAYTVGQTLELAVVFTAPVFVDTSQGQPILALMLSAHASSAKYSGGSGTDTLIFKYQVQAGDDADPLDYNGVEALILNGATIKDRFQQNANNRLPSPGATGSLSTGKLIIIDTVLPIMLNAVSTTSQYSSLSETPEIAWTGANDGPHSSGITSYEVALGSSAGAVNILNWITSGTQLSIKLGGLKLTDGMMIYPQVRAVDRAGNKSVAIGGQGWRVRAPTLATPSMNVVPRETASSTNINSATTSGTNSIAPSIHTNQNSQMNLHPDASKGREQNPNEDRNQNRRRAEGQNSENENDRNRRENRETDRGWQDDQENGQDRERNGDRDNERYNVRNNDRDRENENHRQNEDDRDRERDQEINDYDNPFNSPVWNDENPTEDTYDINSKVENGDDE